MLRLFKVTESSLVPAYQDGDFVLISKIPVLLRRLRPGDTVVFRHPIYGILIKQVESIQREQLRVVGLVEESIDSRIFGPVRIHDVIGKVILRIPKP